MPKFKVSITEPAKKNLLQIEPKSRLRILRKLEILKSSPFPTIKPIRKIKMSRKIALFELRVGNYRIVFHIRAATVHIFAVIFRRDFDYAIPSVVGSAERWNWNTTL